MMNAWPELPLPCAIALFCGTETQQAPGLNSILAEFSPHQISADRLVIPPSSTKLTFVLVDLVSSQDLYRGCRVAWVRHTSDSRTALSRERSHNSHANCPCSAGAPLVDAYSGRIYHQHY